MHNNQPEHSTFSGKMAYQMFDLQVVHFHKDRELGPFEMEHCDPCHVNMQAGDQVVEMEQQTVQFLEEAQQVKDMDQGRPGYA